MPRGAEARRRFTESGAFQRRKARRVKSAQKQAKQKFPFSAALRCAPKRAGPSAKRRRLRRTAARRAKLTRFRQRHASGCKSRRAPQTAAAAKFLRFFRKKLIGSNRRLLFHQLKTLGGLPPRHSKSGDLRGPPLSTCVSD